MVFPTKNITNTLTNCIPYGAAAGTASALTISVNAIAKAVSVCTGTGSVTYHAVPAGIERFLPATTCPNNVLTAAAWLAATAVFSYTTYKSWPRQENAQTEVPLSRTPVPATTEEPAIHYSGHNLRPRAPRAPR